MILRTLSALLALLAGLVSTGCGGDPVGPRPIEGTYEAVSANDQPLPAFINPDGSVRSGRQLTDASLALDASGSLMLVMNMRILGGSGEVQAVSSDTLWARYHAEGSQLLLSRMAGHPLLLETQASVRSGGTVSVTAKLPLPPSGGFAGTYPVEMLFRR